VAVPKPKTFEDNVGVRIIRLAEVFTRLAKIGVEQPWNLRNTDLRILNTLDGAESVAISEIARRTHVDKAWISRSVRELEKNGLIEKRVDPKDSRVSSATSAACSKTPRRSWKRPKTSNNPADFVRQVKRRPRRSVFPNNVA
jgi:DNA-binding transcriptional ArsR family regulator